MGCISGTIRERESRKRKGGEIAIRERESRKSRGGKEKGGGRKAKERARRKTKRKTKRRGDKANRCVKSSIIC